MCLWFCRGNVPSSSSNVHCSWMLTLSVIQQSYYTIQHSQQGVSCMGITLQNTLDEKSWPEQNWFPKHWVTLPPECNRLWNHRSCNRQRGIQTIRPELEPYIVYQWTMITPLYWNSYLFSAKCRTMNMEYSCFYVPQKSFAHYNIKCSVLCSLTFNSMKSMWETIWNCVLYSMKSHDQNNFVLKVLQLQLRNTLVL